MTQEEKAKAYDEAIKKAKEYETRDNCLVRPHVIFPELKESEDDRIRKDLIAFLDDIWHLGKNANFDKWDKSDCSNWIVWLEKQGEQKPAWSEDDENEYNHILKVLNSVAEEQETKGYNNLIGTDNWLKSIKDRIQSKQSNKPQDKSVLEATNEKPSDNTNKVQPKFEVGDWIFYSGDYCGGVRHITKINENGYYIERNGLPHGIIPFKDEIHMRLWTIQDAKDGDIIYAKSKSSDFSYICIFFKLENGNSWDHCYINSKDSKHWNFEYGKGFLRLDDSDFYPASKEQRDLLFQKMEESDYEWDFENKEVMPLI